MTWLYFSRILFDLFKSQGRSVIVVEGDDVVNRTKEMTDNVCNAIGIDPEGVTQTWKTTPEEDRHPNVIIRAFLSTIYDSTGVERSAEKVREPDFIVL